MKDKENCQFVSSLVSRIFGQVVANLFFIHISHIYQVWDFKIQYFSLIQPWNFPRNWRTLTGKPLLYSFLEKNKAKLGITPTIRERLMNRVTRHKKSDRWNFICAFISTCLYTSKNWVAAFYRGIICRLSNIA